jgi:hypothetical protein
MKIKIYRTTMFPVVVHGYKNVSLTLGEECRLRVFENRVLKKIFGSKREEVTGDCRISETRSSLVVNVHKVLSR